MDEAQPTPTNPKDSVAFSQAALDANAALKKTDADEKSGLSATQELTPDEKAQVQELKRIDQHVRQHEQAHLAAAAGYARGGARFTYATGPDGKRYATGGEVSIDVSSASTPEATIQKMEIVKHAALAPADPSPQDRAVYAQAQSTEMEARQQQAEERAQEASPSAPSSSASPSPHA